MVRISEGGLVVPGAPEVVSEGQRVRRYDVFHYLQRLFEANRMTRDLHQGNMSDLNFFAPNGAPRRFSLTRYMTSENGLGTLVFQVDAQAVGAEEFERRQQGARDVSMGYRSEATAGFERYTVGEITGQDRLVPITALLLGNFPHEYGTTNAPFSDTTFINGQILHEQFRTLGTTESAATEEQQTVGYGGAVLALIERLNRQ